MLDYSQQRYAYRLLTLLDEHSIKDILPVTFRFGDKSVQPRKLPENGEIWDFKQKVRNFG